MDKMRGVVIILAITVGLSLVVAPAGATFIGTSIPLSNQLGGTINVGLGNGILAGDSNAFGLANMNVGVDWGVNYDLATMAGYPYGYGGIGAVTTGDMGWNLGLTMDEMHGSGFNGAEWGIPLTQQGLTQTHLAQNWANAEQINSVNAILPFTSFPAI